MRRYLLQLAQRAITIIDWLERLLLRKQVGRLLLAALLGLLVVGLGAIGYYLLNHGDLAVLSPEGTVADKQRNLMIFGALLSLIVVLPVFAMTFYFVWKYRASNTKARYTPDWDHNRVAETIWWTVPLTLILILSVVTWKSSHDLDPFKPLASDTPSMTVQVVALPWKWLFIYPEQGIATVNYVQFPQNTPINFEITADAPMNSFWIPKLGGQVYAMAGMKTKLHLQANKVGLYDGSSANLSGEGFAGMRFSAQSATRADFDAWIADAKQSPDNLTLETYADLAEPSKNEPITIYAAADKKLYDSVIMKYMMPPADATETTDTNEEMVHTHY